MRLFKIMNLFQTSAIKTSRNPEDQFSQEQINHAKFTRNRFSVNLCYFIDIFWALK